MKKIIKKLVDNSLVIFIVMLFIFMFVLPKISKSQIRPLTQDDFVPKVYDWTKVSRFAITKDKILVRYDGHLEDGFPIYMCLHQG